MQATSYADRLRVGVAVIHGEQKEEEEAGTEDGRQSPPPNYAPFELFPTQVRNKGLTVLKKGILGVSLFISGAIVHQQTYVSNLLFRRFGCSLRL